MKIFTIYYFTSLPLRCISFALLEPDMATLIKPISLDKIIEK